MLQGLFERSGEIYMVEIIIYEDETNFEIGRIFENGQIRKREQIEHLRGGRILARLGRIWMEYFFL